MSQVASFRAEAKDALRALWRLFRADPAWADGMTFTAGGFLRSFGGPLLALPLYVLDTALVERAMASGRAAPAQALWAAGTAHLVDAVGFPLVLAALAAPLRFKAGYAAFVTLNNWASFYLNLMLLAAALLTLLGSDGVQAFSWASLLLLCLSVVLVWRIARETLTHELAPIVLVVVGSIAWSAFADLGARAAFGV